MKKEKKQIHEKKSVVWNTIFARTNIVNPRRDWAIILALAGLFLSGTIAYDLYMYTRIQSGDMYVGVNRSDLIIENLRTAELDTVIDGYERRERSIPSLLRNISVDPSL